MRAPFAAALLLFSTIPLSGCSIFGQYNPIVAGANDTVIQRTAISQVDLIVALDPKGIGETLALCARDPSDNSKCKTVPSGEVSDVNLERLVILDMISPITFENNKPALIETDKTNTPRQQLERAFAGFYSTAYASIGSDKARRNRLVNRLIAASNANCRVFKEELYTKQSQTNFVLGGLATAVTGAGAIVTQATPARTLSGIGSILTGIRAEANEDFYRKAYVEAIAQALDNKRSDLLTEIDGKIDQETTTYPVERAVADAIRYNDACSIVQALQTVNRAVVISDDPAGMKAFREAFVKAGFVPDITLRPIAGAYDYTQTGYLTVPEAQAQIAVDETTRAANRLWAVRSQNLNKICSTKPTAGTDEKKKQDAAIAHINTAAKKVWKTADAACGTDPATTPPLADGEISFVISQLGELKTSYDKLRGEWGKKSTLSDQSQVESMMRANDRAAAATLAVARNILKNAEEEILGASFDFAPNP